ncbi:phage tail tape measure protein [Abyssicoccus albus]|uniref:TP901 family phage tail tape measure protein n=1 Tax=Abyssicoccus albus TaxID=1817405 RepID=A0A3N5BCJ6_9BACL|nr:phage tail tape measure protein [Abyssicoccus albus]RPF54729.1 TP901 family phage tail tape measure protein [Abyssicoccus albus]
MAVKHTVAARLVADTGQFIAGFAAAEAAVRKFNGSLVGVRANEAVSSVNNMNRSFAQTDKDAGKAARQLDRFNRTARGFSMVGMGAAVAVGAAVQQSIKSFSGYESAFAGVKKTVEATNTEYRELDKTFRKMSTQMPATYEEISKVAEMAGQLGVKKDSIADFTETMIRLGESTVLSAEDAATSISRFTNVMGTSMDEVDNIGSALVDLGNNFATTEDEIMQMSLRLVGMGKQMGMSESDVLALAASMSSVGIKAEMGGSAMSRVMTKMNKALQSGGKEAQAWADVMGLSVEEASRLMKDDAYEALMVLLEGFEKSSKGGANLDQILGELGLTEIREVDTLKRLTNATDLSRDARDKAGQSYKENTALVEESSKRFETFASQVEMAKNKVKNILANLGELFVKTSDDIGGAINGILDYLEDMTNKFFDAEGNVTEFGKAFADTAKTIGGITGVLGLASAAFFAFGPKGAVTVAVLGGLGLIIKGVSDVKKEFSKGDLEKSMGKIETISDETSRNSAKSYLEMKDNINTYMGQLKTQSGKEAEETRGKIVGEFEKLASEVTRALDKEQAEIEGFIDAAMEGATEPQKQALIKTRNEVEKQYNAMREQVSQHHKTITNVIKNETNEQGQITQAGMQKMAEAVSGMDAKFGTAVAGSVRELGVLGAELDKIVVTGSPKEIQKQMTEMGKNSADAIGELSKAQRKQAEEIKTWNLAEEEKQHLLAASDEMYESEKLAIYQNLAAHEERAQEVDENIKATEGLSTAQQSALGTYEDYRGVVKSASEGMEVQRKAWSRANDALDEHVSKIRNMSRDYGDFKTRLVDLGNSTQEVAFDIGEGFVSKVEEGVQYVDLGKAGEMKLEEFIEKFKAGEISMEQAGLAQINAFRNIIGQESLSEVGTQKINEFVTSLKQGEMSVKEFASQFGLTFKEGMKVDLGPAGIMSIEKFQAGLQSGEYGAMEVAYLMTENLATALTKDLSAVGQQDIQTLASGLSSGMISVDEVMSALDGKVKEGATIELAGHGTQTMQSLVAGLQEGEISVAEFLTGVETLVKDGLTMDMTEEGRNVLETKANGIGEGIPSLVMKTTEARTSVENELGKTTDGGGGDNSMSVFEQSISGKMPTLNETVLGAKGSVEDTLGSTTDGGGGAGSMDTYGGSIKSKSGEVNQLAESVRLGVETALAKYAQFGVIGSDSGSEYAGGIEQKAALATAAGDTLGFGALNGIMGVAGFDSEGSEDGSNYASGAESKVGEAKGSGEGLALGTISGVRLVNLFFKEGGEDGGEYKDGVQNVVGAAKAAGNAIATSAKNGISAIFGYSNEGRSDGREYSDGVNGQSGAARNSGRSVAQSSKNGMGSIGGAYSLGRDLVSGYIRGIQSLGGAVWSAAKSIASRAWRAIKRTQKSNSPSKVTMGLGNDFGDGYVLGIEDRQRKVAKIAGDMAKSGMDALGTNHLNRKFGEVNGSMNANVTRRVNQTMNLTNKQPAYITVDIGGQEFRRFSDNIHDENKRTVRINEIYS